jgi:hypothetical protein
MAWAIEIAFYGFYEVHHSYDSQTQISHKLSGLRVTHLCLPSTCKAIGSIPNATHTHTPHD